MTWRRVTQTERAQWAALYVEGWSGQAIANRSGRPLRTVQNHLRALGVKSRGYGRSPRWRAENAAKGGAEESRE